MAVSIDEYGEQSIDSIGSGVIFVPTRRCRHCGNRMSASTMGLHCNVEYACVLGCKED